METVRVRRRADGLRPGLAQITALPLVAGLIWLLGRQLVEVDLAEVRATLNSYSPLAWGLAVTASGLSFLAVGRYDAVIHARLRTGVPPPRARRTGMRAVALGQVAGFSLVTSSLVRWRTLPEISATTAALVTGCVALSFMAALSVLLATVLSAGLLPTQTVLPDGVSGWPLALIGLALFGAGAVGLARRHLRRRDGAVLLLWTALDTVFAAGSLWVFLPAGTDLVGVWAIYLLALGAGLLSNAPGGVGAFELVLIACLPEIPLPDLMTAILAHRLCYYALPAACALPGLIAPRAAPVAPLAPVRSTDVTPRPAAHWGLVHQGARVLASAELSTAWLVRPAPLSLVAIGPGHRARHASDAFRDLQESARLLGRLSLFYHLDARSAARARAHGLSVWRVAREAWVSPLDWDISGRNHRQLRRKLRHAERAGVRCDPAHHPLPLDQMAVVASKWSRDHRLEKGFSMGRFSPDLVRHQKVFLAWLGTEMLGFVTFNSAPGEWELDLIRYRADVPDGTMHGLITVAIDAAHAAGVDRLSLGAVPDMEQPFCRLGLRGLCQFKSAFAPDWSPLFAAAPGPVGLGLGLLAVAWAVHHPHDEVEDFAFELRPAPCDQP